MDKKHFLGFILSLFLVVGTYSVVSAIDYAPFVWENWDPPCVGAYWACAEVEG